MARIEHRQYISIHCDTIRNSTNKYRNHNQHMSIYGASKISIHIQKENIPTESRMCMAEEMTKL
jgi:hypothetical protein